MSVQALFCYHGIRERYGNSVLFVVVMVVVLMGALWSKKMYSDLDHFSLPNTIFILFSILML